MPIFTAAKETYESYSTNSHISSNTVLNLPVKKKKRKKAFENNCLGSYVFIYFVKICRWGKNKSRWVERWSGPTCLLSDCANSAARSETQAPCQQPNQLKAFWNFSLHFRPCFLIRQSEQLHAGCARWAHPMSLQGFSQQLKNFTLRFFSPPSFFPSLFSFSFFKPGWDYRQKKQKSYIGVETRHSTRCCLL